MEKVLSNRPRSDTMPDPRSREHPKWLYKLLPNSSSSLLLTSPPSPPKPTSATSTSIGKNGTFPNGPVPSTFIVSILTLVNSFPQLVEIFLRKYQPKLIVDPFCGSGTTLVEASSLGIDSFGADISEFNCLLAQVKIAEYDLDVLESEIRDILARSTEDVGADEQLRLLERQAAYFSNCYLQDWFAPKAQQELLAYRDLISDHGGQKPKYKYQNVLKVILSRAARSARQTPHFDLDFPKVPQKEPYHCYKHSRICRPTSTARQFLTRYSNDTIKRIKEFAGIRKPAHAEADW